MFERLLTGTLKRLGASGLEILSGSPIRPTTRSSGIRTLANKFQNANNKFHTHSSSTKLKHSYCCYTSSRMVTTTNLADKQLVAVCQLNCTNDKDANFNTASSIVSQAASVGAKMVFLPECFDFIGTSKQESLDQAEPLDGPTLTRYKDLAKKLNVWLSLGGMHQKNTDPSVKKLLNAHIILDNLGEIRCIYHKVHLFNLEIPNVVRLIEGEFYVAGDRLPEPVASPVGKVGLGICYDLRFAEMAIAYAKAGADILTYPSSFTVPTGIHHWEPLIRSRAIENQCYVIAAAQVGTHNPKRSSFGHAMIVDPWGTKIAECSDGPGFAVGLIDREFIKKCRSRLPIWSDRRTDIYADIEPAVDSYDISGTNYKFQDMSIPEGQVFCRTRHSFAFVNHRPVLNGHVLVSPMRVCKKFKELSRAEVSDLMLLVQRVEKAIERLYETESTTITIQDGIDAGQSVFHVHVHLLPRKPTDFGGNIDKIYRELQRHDKQEFKKEYKKLSDDEMAAISSRLRECM
uniref:Nitrilase and fragile histidine triad fusion protein NitFhit n=1 Tax=Aceria tosichella TaxID=561515 RepID=A0A6G1SDD5_9ACAR